MLGAGYQAKPVKVQDQYIRCRLSEYSSKCAALVCYLQAIRL